MPTQVITLIVVGAVMFLVIGGLAFLSHYYTLDGIKSKTVGDGQHGTARWATKQEIRQTYAHVPFEPELWRKGEHLPEKQGLVLGCEGPKDHVTALVDTDDIHAMVTAASGAGKTAFFLYPNIEYALASGMSFLCTDTKGDLFRNYAGIAKDCYGYQIAVLDLRIILLEQLRTIDKSRLRDKLGSLGEDQMCKLDHALEVSVGLLPIYNTI